MINPPIPMRFDGIARYAREHGWHMTLANRLVRAPSGWNGDGALVTLRGDPETTRFAEECIKAHISVVDLTAYMPQVAVPRVIPDYRAAGRLAADHFAAIGLKRVAFFSTIWTRVHALFFDGLVSRWPDAAKITLADFVPKSRLDDIDRFTDAMAARLMALPKPIGILTYNDEEAARLLTLALSIGLAVPEEVAILGIGNDTFLCENQSVPISSVIDDLDGNGYAAAALLDRLMAGEPPPTEPLLVPCRGLVERRSTDTLAVESPALRRALEAIARNFANPPSTTQLAEAAGVSRATLDRLFLAELGRSPRAEILRRRIAHAKSLLTETGATCGEVAAKCGFCNPGHFVNAFRKAVGTTPAAWRREAVH